MEKLKKLLKYASQDNEFYKKIIKENGVKDSLDIKQYPILTRELLQKNNHLIISGAYIDKKYMNTLIRQFSSGTTGVPVTTFWDPIQYDKSILNIWRRRKKYYGISPTDKYVRFNLKYYNSLQTDKLYYIKNENILSINRLSLKSEAGMHEFFEVFEEYRPVWLQISPSVLEYIYDYDMSIISREYSYVKYVEFLSEVLTEPIRQKAQRLFPNAAIANMYGSEEMNCIAYECPCGNLHVLEDNVYVECLSEEEVKEAGKGRIIITSLYNYSMPLIRYDQGDFVEIVENIKCNCGESGKIISELRGRTSTVAYIGGNKIDTCDMSDIMIIVNNRFGNPIKHYRIIYYESKMMIVCYLTFDRKFENWRNVICDFITELMSEKVGDIKIEMVYGELEETTYKQDLFRVIKKEVENGGSIV